MNDQVSDDNSRDVRGSFIGVLKGDPLDDSIADGENARADKQQWRKGKTISRTPCSRHVLGRRCGAHMKPRYDLSRKVAAARATFFLADPHLQLRVMDGAWADGLMA
jgi:hypothetical protein